MNTPMVDRWSSFVPPSRLPNKFDLGYVEKLISVKGGVCGFVIFVDSGDCRRCESANITLGDMNG